MKRIGIACMAVFMALFTCGTAFGAWEMVSEEYNPDGTVKSATYVFTNGGEAFDSSRLTWAEVDTWKVKLIDGQALTPRVTGHKELDALVEKRLAGSIRQDMSNFEKLRAIYDDIVKNCTYSVPVYSQGEGYNPWDVNPPKTYLMSYKDCEYAKYLLKNNAGVCDEFSAAFVAMANAVGFEAYDMAGRINGNGHGWAVLRLGQEYYIFDPQAEQVNIRSNHVRYMNFCTNAAGSTAYVPVEGCLAEQKSYRQNGAASVTSFLKNEEQAAALEQKLTAYGESLGMVYNPTANRRFWDTRASAYQSQAALLEVIRPHIQDMSGWMRATGYFNIVVEPSANGDGDYIIYVYE